MEGLEKILVSAGADSSKTSSIMQVPNQQTGEPKDLDDDSHSIMQISESMFPTIEEGKTETDPGQFVVPRSERRGPFAQFTWVLEAKNPKAYPRRIKWCITYIVAVAAAAAPMGSTIFFRKRRTSSG